MSNLVKLTTHTFYKKADRPVVSFFCFLREKASRDFVVSTVIFNTCTAVAFPGTRFIGAGAVFKIVWFLGAFRQYRSLHVFILISNLQFYKYR